MSTRERVARRPAIVPRRGCGNFLPGCGMAQAPHRQRAGIVARLFLCAWAFDAAFAVRHGFFDLRVYYGAITTGSTAPVVVRLSLPVPSTASHNPPLRRDDAAHGLAGWHVASRSACCSRSRGFAVLYWLVEPIARACWSKWFVVASRRRSRSRSSRCARRSCSGQATRSC